MMDLFPYDLKINAPTGREEEFHDALIGALEPVSHLIPAWVQTLRIDIHEEASEDDEDTVATVSSDYDRNLGIVEIFPDFWAQKDDDQQATMVEEIAHLHQQAITQWAIDACAKIERGLGEGTAEVFREQYVRIQEKSAAYLASVFRNSLQVEMDLVAAAAESMGLENGEEEQAESELWSESDDEEDNEGVL